MKQCISCHVTTLDYNSLGEYCPSCFSIFATNLPSNIELATYYNEFNKNYRGGGRKNKGAVKRQIKYANSYLKLIKEYANGKSLIDIGPSTNPFPNIAHTEGYEVTIVDFVKPINLNKNINFIKSTLENINTSSKSYDIVTAFAILEHTRFPLVALKKLVNICKKGGIVVIYIPEIGHFNDINALGLTGWFSPPEHLNLLSKKSLDSIMLTFNCNLIFNSRFEISTLRYILRYGYGFFEGVIGLFVKTLNHKIWLKIRRNSISRHNGMSMFVYSKQ